MAGFAESNSRARKERERCLALVRAYREKLEQQALTNRAFSPGSVVKTKSGVVLGCLDAARIMEGVASQLMAVEYKIEHPRDAPESDGNFSLDEMAKAEQIIAEQEYNPFEG